MNGRLETATLDSPALRGNPLGDPPSRSVLFYLPPRYDAGGRYPTVTFLHGFGGGVGSWTSFSGFAPTVPDRLDALIASGAVPPAIGVFVDGWTAIGGSQWLNGPSVGRYQDYVADDVVALADARLRTVPHPEARAVIGKSSGGYGALSLGRDRPDVFAHLGAHAADAYFEYCYLPDFPKAAAALEGGDPETWLAGMRRRARETKLRGDDHPVLNVLAMAACYAPAPGAPLGDDLPFEPETGRLRDEVWRRWLAHDPVRFVPARIESFRRLRSVFLDCGTRDEFHLRWGARMVAQALRDAGVDVVHEEFDDGHRDINYRLDRSLRHLVPRLART